MRIAFAILSVALLVLCGLAVVPLREAIIRKGNTLPYTSMVLALFVMAAGSAIVAFTF